MNIKYCIECAEPYTKHDDTHYSCRNGHHFYNNPSTATCLILLDKTNQVLFAKRAHEPQKGLYDLPGGFVEFGEQPEAAIHRELREEAGISIGEVIILTTATNHYTENVTTTDLIYLAKEWGGEIVAADDVESFAWRPPELLRSENYAWPEAHEPVYIALKRYLNNHDK